MRLRPKVWPKILENVKECVLLDIGDGKKFLLPENFRNLLVTELYYFHTNMLALCDTLLALVSFCPFGAFAK